MARAANPAPGLDRLATDMLSFKITLASGGLSTRAPRRFKYLGA